MHETYFTYHILGGSGKDDYVGISYDTILSFDTSSYEWSNIGNMTHSRYGHAVSTVQEEDVLKYCRAPGPGLDRPGP